MPPQDTATLPRRRVFAETVAPGRLCERGVLAALRERGIQLVVSALPGERPLRVVASAREAGVSVAVWPMLHDAHGRWANTANATGFAAHAEAVLAELDRADALPDELCLDLEPPLPLVRRAIDRPGSTARVAGTQAEFNARMGALIAGAAGHGVASWGTVVPLVLADSEAAPTWQRLLGTPVDPLALSRVSVMLYTSLIVGYSRGALRRRDAEFLLHGGALRARVRFGPRAAVALGAIGTGALRDEAVYRDVAELRRDVALVRAAGIEDIALFDLGGALDRGPVERWLDALDEPAATVGAQASRRARALWWLCGGVARAGAFTRW